MWKECKIDEKKWKKKTFVTLTSAVKRFPLEISIALSFYTGELRLVGNES